MDDETQSATREETSAPATTTATTTTVMTRNEPVLLSTPVNSPLLMDESSLMSEPIIKSDPMLTDPALNDSNLEALKATHTLQNNPELGIPSSPTNDPPLTYQSETLFEAVSVLDAKKTEETTLKPEREIGDVTFRTTDKPETTNNPMESSKASTELVDKREYEGRNEEKMMNKKETKGLEERRGILASDIAADPLKSKEVPPERETDPIANSPEGSTSVTERVITDVPIAGIGDSKENTERSELVSTNVISSVTESSVAFRATSTISRGFEESPAKGSKRTTRRGASRQRVLSVDLPVIKLTRSCYVSKHRVNVQEFKKLNPHLESLRTGGLDQTRVKLGPRQVIKEKNVKNENTGKGAPAKVSLAKTPPSSSANVGLGKNSSKVKSRAFVSSSSSDRSSYDSDSDRGRTLKKNDTGSDGRSARRASRSSSLSSSSLSSSSRSRSRSNERHKERLQKSPPTKGALKSFEKSKTLDFSKKGVITSGDESSTDDEDDLQRQPKKISSSGTKIVKNPLFALLKNEENNKGKREIPSAELSPSKTKVANDKEAQIEVQEETTSEVNREPTKEKHTEVSEKTLAEDFVKDPKSLEVKSGGKFDVFSSSSSNTVTMKSSEKLPPLTPNGGEKIQESLTKEVKNRLDEGSVDVPDSSKTLFKESDTEQTVPANQKCKRCEVKLVDVRYSKYRAIFKNAYYYYRRFSKHISSKSHHQSHQRSGHRKEHHRKDGGDSKKRAFVASDESEEDVRHKKRKHDDQTKFKTFKIPRRDTSQTKKESQKEPKSRKSSVSREPLKVDQYNHKYSRPPARRGEESGRRSDQDRLHRRTYDDTHGHGNHSRPNKRPVDTSERSSDADFDVFSLMRPKSESKRSRSEISDPRAQEHLRTLQQSKKRASGIEEDTQFENDEMERRKVTELLTKKVIDNSGRVFSCFKARQEGSTTVYRCTICDLVLRSQAEFVSHVDKWRHRNLAKSFREVFIQDDDDNRNVSSDKTVNSPSHSPKRDSRIQDQLQSKKQRIHLPNPWLEPPRNQCPTSTRPNPWLSPNSHSKDQSEWSNEGNVRTSMFPAPVPALPRPVPASRIEEDESFVNPLFANRPMSEEQGGVKSRDTDGVPRSLEHRSPSFGVEEPPNIFQADTQQRPSHGEYPNPMSWSTPTADLPVPVPAPALSKSVEGSATLSSSNLSRLGPPISREERIIRALGVDEAQHGAIIQDLNAHHDDIAAASSEKDTGNEGSDVAFGAPSDPYEPGGDSPLWRPSEDERQIEPPRDLRESTSHYSAIIGNTTSTKESTTSGSGILKARPIEQLVRASSANMDTIISSKASSSGNKSKSKHETCGEMSNSNKHPEVPANFNNLMDTLINKLSKNSKLINPPLPPAPPKDLGVPPPPPLPSSPPRLPPLPPSTYGGLEKLPAHLHGDPELRAIIDNIEASSTSTVQEQHSARARLQQYLQRHNVCPNFTSCFSSGLISTPSLTTTPPDGGAEGEDEDKEISDFMSTWLDSDNDDDNNEVTQPSAQDPALSSALAKLRAKRLQH